MSETHYVQKRVLCSDGKYRTALVRCYFDGSSWQMYADTFFSVPARVKAKGKSVAGYVTGSENSETGLEFRSYKYRVNGNVI